MGVLLSACPQGHQTVHTLADGLYCAGQNHIFESHITNSCTLEEMGGPTHVILVFGHGCDCVFVGAELYVCLSSRLAVRSKINVDSHRIQRREKL